MRLIGINVLCKNITVCYKCDFCFLKNVARLSPIILGTLLWQPLCALHGALLETDFIGAIHVLSITLFLLL